MTDEISTIKGVFVFAATIIGAGILALPVAAAITGLVPMLLILLVVGGVAHDSNGTSEEARWVLERLPELDIRIDNVTR